MDLPSKLAFGFAETAPSLLISLRITFRVHARNISSQGMRTKGPRVGGARCTVSEMEFWGGDTTAEDGLGG